MKLSGRNEQNAKAISAFWGKQIDKEPVYNINSLSEDNAEIFIFDVLGWPFNDINVMVKDISQIKADSIFVRLNSPGGDIIDSFALYHALKEHPAKVTVRIEALAASAASVVAMAGDVVTAYSSSLFMIHNSWGFTAGNQYELVDMSQILKKIDSSMVDIYHARSGLGKNEIVDMMKAETWFTAKEAEKHGLIDSIVKSGSPSKAKFDLSMFANTPEEFKPKVEPLENPNIREVEAILRDVGGLSKDKAKAVLARGWKAIGDNLDIDGTKDVAKQALKKFMRRN